MPTRLLFVLAPSATRTGEESDAYWAAAWLTQAEVRDFLTEQATGLYADNWPGRRDFAKGCTPTGHLPFFLHEMLLSAIIWGRDPQVDVDILSFNNFRGIILEGDGARISAYCAQYDIIYGGVNYTTDSVELGDIMTRQDETEYVRRMEGIRHSVFVWPPPRQTLAYRRKLDYIGALDRCARLVTGTWRPRTEILTSPAQFHAKSVLKRDASGRCSHRVFFVGGKGKSARVANEAVAHNGGILQRRNEGGENCEAQYEPLWFVQDLVPTLRRYGEWRIYVVDEDVVSVLGTALSPADEWWTKDCMGFCPLDKIRREMAERADPFDVLVYTGGSLIDRNRAKSELSEFVRATIGALAREDELRWGERSVLRDFVRLDVSFGERPDGRVDYFVNEVEVGHDVCYFTSKSDMAEVVLGALLQVVLAGYRRNLCAAPVEGKPAPVEETTPAPNRSAPGPAQQSTKEEESATRTGCAEGASHLRRLRSSRA
ncbi:hypothetical protein DFH06DRAFT_1410048 [Mycena polygramma]|nr:hypothetical protein DFH06DRAFT_1410048 [Mycena polygramma]